MKRVSLIFSICLLAFAPAAKSQTWANLTPDQKEALIYKSAVAVWIRLTPEVRQMPHAKELVTRLSQRPAWRTWTRAERITKATQFITNYPALRAARNQERLAAALAEATSAYPVPPARASLEKVVVAPKIDAIPATGDPGQLASEVRVPVVAPLPVVEVPDLFTIDRLFNWNQPHGQWMNQMLKDIDAAKAAGDSETYNRLTKQYSAWAEKYLLR